MVKYLIFLLLISTGLKAQSVSQKIDSITRAHYNLLKPAERKSFTALMSLSEKENYLPRLDSEKYDAVLIEATFCKMDSLPFITERYFSDSNRDYFGNNFNSDSIFIPYKLYLNGDTQMVLPWYYGSSTAGMNYYNLIDQYYTLDTIVQNYSRLNAIQTLTYDPTIAWFMEGSESYFLQNKSRLEAEKKQRLKETCQVVIFIDKRTNNFRVSFQLPPEDPQLQYRFLYTSHDW